MTTKMQRQEGAQLKNEMCGASKAERAERSGMPVMLSVSETSHFAKPSP
jgi:hypothetical protein